MTGFTLIEIMVVVVIIGLLAAIVAPNVMNQLDRATEQRVRSDIGQIVSAIKLFRTQHFRYPTDEEGIEVLTGVVPALSELDERRVVQNLDRIPVDPWGNAYLYRYPGDHGEYDVFTYGADGEEGGEDLNADVGNWNLND
jgi:general secretion pathway protein G